MSRLLSIDEAAAVLNLSRLTLNTYRCRGRGPRFVKAGNEVFYRAADLAQWNADGRPKRSKPMAARRSSSTESYRGNSNRTKWPWRSLGIGQSFTAPTKNISGSISYQHRHTPRRFSMRQAEAGVIVTRIA